MKITEKDLELQSRFLKVPCAIGFGTSPKQARVSTEEVLRLLKLGLIVLYEHRCSGFGDLSKGNGFHRDHSYFLQSKK